ncbi:MAG: hypothetical protein JXD22_12130 [Sedimentisphaerales bacterium]|nr:hypothetical protein [Sedimentisphaerales bacterium]
MKKLFLIIRLIVFVLLFGIGGLGVYLGVDLLRHYGWSCGKIRDYEAVCLPVDLSVAKEYRGIFKQKYIPDHGKQLRLEVDPSFDSREEMVAAIGGVEVRILITKPGGEVVLDEQVKFDGSQFWDVADGGVCGGYAEIAANTPCLLYDLSGAGYEGCEFLLEVKQPSEGMAGYQQVLVSKNVYCRTAVELSTGLGKVFVVVGGVLVLGGLVVGARWIRRSVK